jgi:hypothetical protein
LYFYLNFLDVSQSAHSNKEINNFESSDNSNDASYDSDKDPLWKIDKSQSINIFSYYQ